MINAAIIGLGKWGQNLVNSVQGKSDKIRFTAGVLRHVENGREFGERHKIVLYDDYRKVLRDRAVDAVVLATPHGVHAKQVIAAAKAGKHVFTEKPFTLTAKSAVKALQACAQRQVTLAVGYNWRFQPALQETKAMLTDGRLGTLLHIEGNFCGPNAYRFGPEHWRQSREEGPAGGMTSRGVHIVDAMLYLAGRIETVHAQSERLAHDYGLDDTTSMLFRFESGATGYLGTVIATAETWRLQVFGSKGWMEVGDVDLPTVPWRMKVCYVDPENVWKHQKPELVSLPEVNTLQAELEHFADAAQAGRALALPGGDEERGVRVLEAILRSARSARTVKIPDLAQHAKHTSRKDTAGTEAKQVYATP